MQAVSVADREPIFESVNSMDQASFARWVDRRQGWDPHDYELLHGRVVVVPPAHFPQGEVELTIGSLVLAAARKRGGRAFGPSQGFELSTGDTVAPDASWVSPDRWAAASPTPGSFLPMTPELAIEVLSPSTAARDRGEKRGIYEAAGVEEYWIVDLERRTISVHVREGERFAEPRTYGSGETVTCTVLPALVVAIDDVCSY